ncbi:diguanylate cyclase [Escherichia coli]|nr:diguanylate cyclase [Escherichia coli]
MIKKTTEIDAILLNLNKAIDAHYQWLVSMFHSVVARDASKPEITDNHSYGLCQLVDNHAITHSEGHINITVTAGVSRAFPEEPLDVVIGRADRAMYEGKQTGRNRCMFIDEQNVINRV